MKQQSNHQEVMNNDHSVVRSLAGFELVKAKGAIEQFIYSCSHTLRGPLKSIAGLVNLLQQRDTVCDLDPNTILDSILKTVVKMEATLNDLEKFLSNSRESIHTEPVHIGSLLKQITNELIMEQKGSRFRVSISCRQRGPFYTDGIRLREVLTQIISNAIHFSNPALSVNRIKIRATVRKNSCQIYIQDNGLGIPDEVLPHIFDLFYRGSAASTGSGVGLYIVKEILNKMGGTVTVKSRLNRGSTFIISVPNLTRYPEE